jgi:DNA-binding transcriptional regulator YdaS (Cro superfamily)
MDTAAEALRFMRGPVLRRSSLKRDSQRDHVMKLIFSKPGFASVIAAHLGVTHQNVSAWNKVPPHHVMKVAPLIEMTPEEIRPDIFGPKKRK